MRRRQAIAVTGVDVSAKAGTSLSQDLEFMPVRLLHRIEYEIDEAERDFFVEKIAHRVDEDHLGVAPAKRLLQPFGPKLEVKAVFKGMAWHTAESFREALGITMITAG